MRKLILVIFLISAPLMSQDVVELAKEYNLQAGSKASVQWERIFFSQRHLKRYKLENLSLKERERLKTYLIEHAADSDQPILPGL